MKPPERLAEEERAEAFRPLPAEEASVEAFRLLVEDEVVLEAVHPEEEDVFVAVADVLPDVEE